MSKTLTFTHGKQVALRFTAEDMQYAVEGESFLLTGEGEVIHQDTPSVEALFQGFTCYFEVMDDAESILAGRYHATLLLLEPHQIAVRVTPE